MSEGNGVPPQATLDLITEALRQLKANGGLDRGELKFGELEDLEDILLRADHPRPLNEEMRLPLHLASYRFMRGVLWLWLRRDHPQLAFDDFRDIDQNTLIDALGEEEEPAGAEPDPTEPPAPSGEPPRPKRSRASATSGG